VQTWLLRRVSLKQPHHPELRVPSHGLRGARRLQGGADRQSRYTMQYVLPLLPVMGKMESARNPGLRYAG